MAQAQTHFYPSGRQTRHRCVCAQVGEFAQLHDGAHEGRPYKQTAKKSFEAAMPVWNAQHGTALMNNSSTIRPRLRTMNQDRTRQWLPIKRSSTDLSKSESDTKCTNWLLIQTKWKPLIGHSGHIQDSIHAHPRPQSPERRPRRGLRPHKPHHHLHNACPPEHASGRSRGVRFKNFPETVLVGYVKESQRRNGGVHIHRV